MHLATLRATTLFMLVVLAGPVVAHVFTHDLHHHHDDHASLGWSAGEAHGDHEHPMIASAVPRVPARVVVIADAPAVVTPQLGVAPRNVIAAGALRIDEDVGLQPLLSTFRI